VVKIKKRRADIPESLNIKGAIELTRLKSLPPEELLAYKFKANLYGSKEVKTKLKALQNDKCCFCEAKVSHVSHGDVEHYRPKAGWIQSEKGKLIKPGYYWLAYDFANLYLACQICNQTYKRNYFPLARPGQRARNHKRSIRKEQPLIIDPGGGDPDRHLTFHEEVMVPRTAKGKETIKRTGLNREEIVRSRFEYLELLGTLARVARGKSSEAVNARAQLKVSAMVGSIYSFMVRKNFPDLVA
jgi:uncharacterized protein (TIGR02646 family)